MSEQHVIAFLNKVNVDTALQGRIQALKSNSLDDLIKLANDDGFTFTADEWQAVKATSFGEINDEALDQVAGGAGPILCNAQPAGILCNGMPVSIQCNEKSAGIFCNEKPINFSNSLSLFNHFGK